MGSQTAAAPQTPARGGLQVDLGFDTKLTVDDNYQLQPNSSGTSTFWDNTFTFDLSSVTGVQDLNLTASGVYRYGQIPGRTVSGLEDPTVRFRYTRDGLNSRLDVNARYRHVAREFLDPFQVEQEDRNAILTGLFLPGGGTVTYRNAGIDYVTGLNDPFMLALSLSHDQTSYDSVATAANPLLFGNKTDSASATATFKFSQITALYFQLGIDEYKAEDSVRTERTTDSFAVGLTHDIDPALALDAQIGYTDVETTTTGGTASVDGLTGAVTLTKTLTNGTVYGSVDSSVNENGTTTSLSFGRDLQLPLGNLTAVVGGTYTPSGDTYVTGSLLLTRQLKTSDLTLAIDRGVSTNTSSADVVDTRVSFTYGYAINNNSRLSLSLNWGQSESVLAGAAPTVERTTLDAAYSYDLTQDWALTGGVSIRTRSDSTSPGDARSNAVFLGLGRSFSYRP
ncbi:MAG: hypothetical protein KDE00_01410 [Rhodobacteraceae bacterium]|nr:hypothetical protein [Paracoccaceae bacterium]